jgi:ATP-dependent Clp protease ATP-binding subunit ClpC
MSPTEMLAPGAQALIDATATMQRQYNQEQPGINHWLLVLLERYGPMAESLTKDLDVPALKRYLNEQIRQGNHGAQLPTEHLTARALARAATRGKTQVMERDIAAAILTAANYVVTTPTFSIPATPATPVTPATPATPVATDTTQPVPPPNPSTVAAPSIAALPLGESRAFRPTPLLEQFGRELTREARESKLPPVVGREGEVQLMIETLCRMTKRNPVLVGPAGSGKTAIVEGLAQRIARGEVPETLRGARLFALQPSTLVAGAGIVGELEKRMKGLLSEAAQDGLLLFIDEVHSIIGAGGAPGSSDMASLLKPTLARGDIACIAATTDDEYRRFIEQDAALERRFQPIRIQEMTPEQTFGVLVALRDTLAIRRGVQVDDAILRWLIEFAQRYLRNRNFPDKAVDLLEQCVAYAITQGKKAVDLAEAEIVAQRLIGMPLAIEQQLTPLRTQLSEQALLGDADSAALIGRLEVTLRGLDLRASRPNAMILLLDQATSASEALAGVIAENLFGSADRVITIDFSRFVHPADVTMLLGAPPGYIGYSDSLPLHRLIQMPWSVLRCEHIDGCHPQVLAVLLQALAAGVLTDARGKRIYLSDTIVILTASVNLEEHRSIGFRQAEATQRSDTRRAAAAALGDEIAGLADVICATLPMLDAARRHFLGRLLADLAERYRSQGLIIHWDISLIDWLSGQQDNSASQLDWERLIDEQINSQLIHDLPPVGERREIVVRYLDGTVQKTAYEA